MIKKIVIIALVIIAVFILLRNIDFTSNPLVSITENSEELETQESVNDQYGVDSAHQKQIDTSLSVVNWFGENKIQNKSHGGTIQVAPSSFVTFIQDPETDEIVQILNGQIILDMSTLAGNREEPEALVSHLRSEDFFDVETYPNADFTIIHADKTHLEGFLTIKGKQETVSVPYSVSENENGSLVTGQFSFNRTDWGITTLSGSFFDDLGDSIIEDEVSVSFVIQTN